MTSCTPGQASGPEAFEERRPEGAVFAVADLHAQDLPVPGGGHAGGDDHRPRHHPAVHPALDVGRVREDVGELDVIQAAVPERVEVPVQLRADPRHLATWRSPSATPRAWTRSSTLRVRHPVHVGLHHHREQGPVDTPAPFQQGREERPGPQLRDLQLDIARRGGHQPGPVTVALRGPGLGALMAARRRSGRSLRPRSAPGGSTPSSSGPRRSPPRPERVEQFGQVMISEGHRRVLLRVPG